jgi:hypothetical protein
MEKVNTQLIDAGIKSISKKQIYDDIKFMKSSEGWEAPIRSYQDGKRKYLRYEYDFSIIETPITEMEVEQLETPFGRGRAHPDNGKPAALQRCGNKK